VEKGTTSLLNKKDYFIARGLAANPVVIDSPAEMAAALVDGRCSAYTGDASHLVATRLPVAQVQHRPLAVYQEVATWN
jgi:general L-amino acid transport system substrate-binding protein